MRQFSYILLFLMCCSLTGYGQADDNTPAFPSVKGWKQVSDYPVYTPGNLWDYINGAADAYLSYGFIDLHIREYTKGKKKNVRVEWYRFPDPVHAFGIYTQERAPDFHFVDIGAEGYQEGTSLNFTAGEFYVKIMSNGTGAGLEQFIYDLGKKVSGLVDPDPKLPAELACFPVSGREPKSESFVAANFMGYEFFSDVYSARYDDGDDRYTMFLTEKSSPGDCLRIIESYCNATGQEYTPGDIHLIKDPYNGLVVIKVAGDRLAGISGVGDESKAGKLLRELDPFLEQNP